MSKVEINERNNIFKPFKISLLIDDVTSAKELWLALCIDKDVIKSQHENVENNFEFLFVDKLFHELASELKRQYCEPRILPKSYKKLSGAIQVKNGTKEKKRKFKLFGWLR